MNEMVEKNGDRGIFAGCCPYCGQYVQVEMVAPWTEEELREASVMACECYQAGEYRKRKARKERARMKINELLQEDCQECIPILDSAVDLILTDCLDKITLDTPEGVKIKVGINSKGNIKVERSETLRRSSEV